MGFTRTGSACKTCRRLGRECGQCKGPQVLGPASDHSRNSGYELTAQSAYEDRAAPDSDADAVELNDMASAANTNVQRLVAAHPTTAPETLSDLSRVEHSEVRRNVAANPKTPKRVLGTLALDDETKVRVEVGRNPATSGEVLGDLCKDASHAVSSEASHQLGVSPIPLVHTMGAHHFTREVDDLLRNSLEHAASGQAGAVVDLCDLASGVTPNEQVVLAYSRLRSPRVWGRTSFDGHELTTDRGDVAGKILVIEAQPPDSSYLLFHDNKGQPHRSRGPALVKANGYSAHIKHGKIAGDGKGPAYWLPDEKRSD